MIFAVFDVWVTVLWHRYSMCKLFFYIYFNNWYFLSQLLALLRNRRDHGRNGRRCCDNLCVCDMLLFNLAAQFEHTNCRSKIQTGQKVCAMTVCVHSCCTRSRAKDGEN